MRIGSLFSGIGGLELGLERAIPNARTVWQVEIDAFCNRVLGKHWPHAKRFKDIRDVSVRDESLERVDLVCGGFPCQDVSSAGKRTGLSGAKSGLWFEYKRIVSELSPRFVVVENVTSGKKLWLPQVKADLESLGYRTRAFGLSASDVGAPHLRRRVFVVATTNPDGIILREQQRRSQRSHGARTLVAPSDGITGLAGDSDGNSQPTLPEHGQMEGLPALASGASPWSVAPVFRGVDDGIPDRLDRLRALGNAVVPQCAEVIGRIIADQ